MYSEEAVEVFLKDQSRLYDEPVAETPEEAQEFLEDCQAVEVENIKRLEAKIVEGPYIHHCVGIHANVVPVLYEACKYMGIKPDLYDPIEEDVKAYLRGE